MGEPAPRRPVDDSRRSVDLATLSEPQNVREYVAMHELLGLGVGDRLLDLDCGAGLALELARARGAAGAGLDAAPRLVAIARDRCPGADLRVGDPPLLPWEDASFDVVTCFRGSWGTTPDALAEIRRVLRPGGRLGLTVWGNVKASTGAWALRPLPPADPPRVDQLLAGSGFVDVRRTEVPFAWEFADPATYARALASTGAADDSLRTMGERAFHDHAVELAGARVRGGLPLRAELLVTGYLTRVPRAESSELTEELATVLAGFARLGRLTQGQRAVLAAAAAAVAVPADDAPGEPVSSG